MSGQVLRLACLSGRRVLTRPNVFSRLPASSKSNQNSDHLLVIGTQIRCKSSKKGGGGGKKKSELDRILEEIEDDEDDIEGMVEVAEVPDTPVTAFIYGGGNKPSSKQKKSKDKSKLKGTSPVKGGIPEYQDIAQVINIESYWSEMENVIDNQNQFFKSHINIRSTNALDDLLVDLEGDPHPLKEVATINKKDPKRLVIDMSTFPQATPSAMQTLRSASLNLNPQQDGLKIYVSLPKVTREHRESVAKAARSRLAETKAELKAVSNKFVKTVDDRQAGQTVSVPKEVFVGTKEVLRSIEQHFIKIADNDFQAKQQDILTVK